jgi:hypothetical protein
MAKKVFYSFHFDNDVMRVQQIRNIGVIEDNKPVSANEWETVRRGNDPAIEKWIDGNMKYRDCVVVLVGEDTANREWVKHEIKKAWNDGRGLVGIHIHNLKCPRNGIGRQGSNPFDQFTVGGTSLAAIVRCYNPNSWDAYGDIKNNLEMWVDEAIRIRKNY